MMGRRALFLLLALVALAVVAGVSVAQDDNRVAVVVDYGDGRSATRCVAFVEPQITGLDALNRSGLVVENEMQAGGAAVCRIDGVGCAVDDCFCACRGGGECRYWSYWQLRDGAWQYAAAGAAQSRVVAGAVEGWVWGAGSVTEAPPPPPVSFDEVCRGAVVAATEQATPAVAWSSYGLFAGVMLLLGGLAWGVRRRGARGGV
jgi:hypothetical protein